MSDDNRSANDPVDEDPSVQGASDEEIVDDWDDWDDEPVRRQGSGIPVWVGVAGVAALLLLVAVLLATRGSDDNGADPVSAGGSTPSGAADGGGEECADWPGIGGLGAPEVVSQPGLHMWSDLEGWHLSRVPGDGVPGLNATVRTNGSEDDLPTQKGVSGGATIEEAGNELKVVLPEGAEASRADFEIGSYASSVTITMTDSGGVLLEPTTFTTGSGEVPSTNPILGSRVMKACGS